MALYAQCSLTLSDARKDVAQSAASQNDPDMLTLAAKAIRQAIERYNNHHPWNFLLLEAPVFGIDGTLGSDYPLPADFGFIYDVRTTTNNKRVIRPMTQREYDWMDPFQNTGIAQTYGLLNSGGTGTIRFYPPLSSGDLVQLDYYRRMALPMESVTVATSSTITNDYTDSNASITNGSNVLTLGTAVTPTTFYPGAVISGPAGIPAGTTVVTILTSTTVQMSKNATATASAQTANFGLNILTTTVANGFNNVRLGAPVSGAGIAAGTTVSRLISTTKVLLSTATAAATGSISVTFDSTSVLLDIPADYERAIMALSKYYFLTDKGGEAERQAAWKEEAQVGMIEAKNKDSTIPDEILAFQPGYLAPQPNFTLTPNSIAWSWMDGVW